MFKKLLKAGMTFALLAGCYVAYVHAFDLAVQQFRTYRVKDKGRFTFKPSRSKVQALALAKSAFSADHWSVTNDQPYAYYNSERGFWMYFLEFEEIQEENGVRYDGKRLKMKPFAMIARSSDGKTTQTLTADKATVDMNQPVGLSSSRQGSEAMKILHAEIEGNVHIHDDRGTPNDPSDDMNISEITYLVFDEGTQQITTDSHVVMKDPDQTTVGDGLLIQLRKADPNAPSGGSTSGFEGAEYLILHKKVRVVLRDVGNSGVLPGASPAKNSPKKGVGDKGPFSADGTSSKKEPTTPQGPSPVVIMSDASMRIELPRKTIPVEEGPPEPPAPTKVRFDRNVVALQSHPGKQPDQLNCDTLQLTLVPGEKAPQTKASGASQDENGEIVGALAGVLSPLATGAATAPRSSSGAFGNLTLQKAHATGHAVWLQLREQGAKVRCSQLIHERRAFYRQPDRTYFGGTETKPIWLEKIDREPVKAGEVAKVTGVTHVMTLDATLYDMGGGLDLSDIVARGPGKLESRPDLKEPVERIAVWQDILTIQNVLGPESQLAQKRVTLTGTRPYFVDVVKKASIDAGEKIIVWLKPKPQPKDKSTGLAAADASASTPASDPLLAAYSIAEDVQATSGSDIAGGGLQIERLQAFRDAHFRAPGKKMEAREVLDAPFVEAEPAPVVAATTPATSEKVGEPAENAGAAGQEAAQDQGQSPAQVASRDAEPKQPAEPTMIGVADRIWAKVALKPGTGLDAGTDRRRSRTAAKPAADSADPASTVAAVPASGLAESDTDIREAWLRGNVSLHEDSPPDNPVNPDGTKAKPKTQDVTGEAVYLDNHGGKGKMLAWVYDRDPHGPRRPGPMPLAKVATDDMTIRCVRIRTDQEHDKVWGDGPGELTQLTERALFSDKKDEPKADPDGGAPDEAEPGRAANASVSSSGGGNRIRTSTRTASGDRAAKGADPTTQPKPKTRGGRPVSDKDLLTITWTKRMEFTGRTTDPDRRPAGRADFYGFPNAKMEDAQLKCNERMIVFTDREVPLGELGAMSKGSTKPGAADEDQAEDGKGRPQVDLSLIYCYVNAVAVSRKYDPDFPEIVQQQLVKSDEQLIYNRKTGEFDVPRAGEVYLWDRDKPKESQKQADEPAPDGDGAVGRPTTTRSTRSGRAVTPTSGRTSQGGTGTTGTVRSTAPAAGRRTTSPSASRDSAPAYQTATPPVSRKLGPLVLTQIFFDKGMKGRFGTGSGNDATQEQSALFFGDIELRRAEIRSVNECFNFDLPLPEDGFYLTSQILRVIQEPRPAGAPASTPNRTFLKAWDNVLVNKGRSAALSSDVATYDSATEQLYAYGEGDRGVQMVQQSGMGQQASPSYGKAAEFNIKTGAGHFVNSDVIQMFDKQTGARPGHVGPPDPNLKPRKKRSQPYKVPNNNMERRGFTGQ